MYIHAVFVGFLGYTGLSLLVYAIQIVHTDFTDIADIDSYKSLLHMKATQQVLPPVLVAAAGMRVRVLVWLCVRARVVCVHSSDRCYGECQSQS